MDDHALRAHPGLRRRGTQDRSRVRRLSDHHLDTLESVEDGFVVLADLPGFDRDEIDVQVRDGRLTVAAVHEGEAEGVYRARSFHESITLPGEVDLEDAEATYSNGVLEVHLPSTDPGDDATSIEIS